MSESGSKLLKKWKPPICTRPFLEHSPESFREHVLSLHEERRAAKAVKPYGVRRNTAGTLVVTVRRKPKWLALDELRELSSDLVSFEELRSHCEKKKIRLFETRNEGELHVATA